MVAFLAERFTESPLVLPPREHVRLIERAAAAGIAGGGIHDALIAATAGHARARLLTRDRRAAITYERFRIDYEILA